MLWRKWRLLFFRVIQCIFFFFSLSFLHFLYFAQAYDSSFPLEKPKNEFFLSYLFTQRFSFSTTIRIFWISFTFFNNDFSNNNLKSKLYHQMTILSWKILKDSILSLHFLASFNLSRSFQRIVDLSISFIYCMYINQIN